MAMVNWRVRVRLLLRAFVECFLGRGVPCSLELAVRLVRLGRRVVVAFFVVFVGRLVVFVLLLS